MNKMNLMLKAVCITLCLLLTTTMNAQDSSPETIYLKNGSVIKGTIIEETREQLKIETPNGSIFIIGSYDVEKVIRSNKSAKNQKPQLPSQEQQKTERSINQEKTPQRRSYSNLNSNSSYKIYETDVDEGYYEDRSNHHSLYKGFVDLGYSFGTSGDSIYDIKNVVNIIGSFIGNNKYSVKFSRFEFSTTHGIVLNSNYNYVPLVFLGGGAGANIYYSEEDIQLYLFPFFVNSRIHFIDGKVSPFADIKLGYSWGYISADILDQVFDSRISLSGLYFAPAIGVRFATGSRSGLYISLGYTNQKISKWNYTVMNIKYSKNWNMNLPAISLKMGFDF
jgi:hypothetical protein